MNKAVIILIILGVLTGFACVAAAAEEGAKDLGAPAADDLAVTGAKGFTYVGIAAVFAMAVAAFGAALSQARTANAALDGTARQPEASGKLMIQMLLAVVFIETLAIYTLVVALILLFVNPLKGLIS